MEVVPRKVGSQVSDMTDPVEEAPSFCNALLKQSIQSLRRECLDHFVSVGLTHLDYLVSEYLEHCHNQRPRRGLGNRPLGGCGPPGDGVGGEVVCRSRLGGVLRHYERKAA